MAESDVINVHIENKEKTDIKKPEETRKHVSKKKVAQNIFFWQLLSFFMIIVVIVFLFVIFLGGSKLSEEEARGKVQSYVDTVLRGQELQAQLGDVNMEHGLYVIDVVLDNQLVKTYLSPDGVLFFPSSIDLDRFNSLVGSFTPPVGEEGNQEVAVVPSTDSIDSSVDAVEETSS